MIRDLGHVVDREKAKIGIFITLAEPTKPMIIEAVKAGFYETPFSKFPKLQIYANIVLVVSIYEDGCPLAIVAAESILGPILDGASVVSAPVSELMIEGRNILDHQGIGIAQRVSQVLFDKYSSENGILNFLSQFLGLVFGRLSCRMLASRIIAAICAQEHGKDDNSEYDPADYLKLSGSLCSDLVHRFGGIIWGRGRIVASRVTFSTSVTFVIFSIR